MKMFAMISSDTVKLRYWLAVTWARITYRLLFVTVAYITLRRGEQKRHTEIKKKSSAIFKQFLLFRYLHQSSLKPNAQMRCFFLLQ